MIIAGNSLPHVSDALIREAQEGNTKSFGEIIALTEGCVQSILLGYIYDRCPSLFYGNKIEEMMTIWRKRVWDNISKYEKRNGAKITTWMITIAIHIFFDSMKKHIREKNVIISFDPVNAGIYKSVKGFQSSHHEGDSKSWIESLPGQVNPELIFDEEIIEGIAYLTAKLIETCIDWNDKDIRDGLRLFILERYLGGKSLTKIARESRIPRGSAGRESSEYRALLVPLLARDTRFCEYIQLFGGDALIPINEHTIGDVLALVGKIQSI